MNNDKKEIALTPPKWEQVISWAMIGYFTIKVFFFAFRIKDKIFPDESSWLGICQVFSRSIFPPSDSPESYSLGLITHIPNLYFFFMGKLLTLNIFGVSDLLYLRTINAIIGVATVYYAFKLVLRVSPAPVVRVVFMVMLTNTIMYTFMFGAVSYDNLTNLFAVLSLYYMVCFFQGRRSLDLFLFSFFILAGALTKITFLPFGLAVVVAFIFSERKQFPKLFGHIRKFLKSSNFQMKCIALFCFVLLGLNVNHYATNYLKYKTLYPLIQHVLPLEECLNYRLFSRDYVVREFKANKLSYLGAQRQALQIREPGDRAAAFSMLKQALHEKNKEETPRVSRFDYTIQWFEMIFHRTYSVAAHLTLSKNDKFVYPYYAIFLLAAGLLLSRPRTCFKGFTGNCLFVSLFYILILQQKVGYSYYTQTGFVGIGLTGRYLFPVIIPLYILVAQGLLFKFPKWWQWGVGLGVCSIFILGEFPWFIQNVTSAWYF